MARTASDAAPIRAVLAEAGHEVAIATRIDTDRQAPAPPSLILVLDAPIDADESTLGRNLRRIYGCRALVVTTRPELAAAADCVVPPPVDAEDWPARLGPLLAMLSADTGVLTRAASDGGTARGDIVISADGHLLTAEDTSRALLGNMLQCDRFEPSPHPGQHGKLIRLDARRGRMVIAIRTETATEHGAGALRVHLRDETGRQRLDALNAGRADVLERIARGEPLHDVLTAIVALVESQYPQWMCSVLRLSEDGRRLLRGVAPRIPEAFNAAIDGAEIGPCAGSCGTAAYHRRTVVVGDIEHDPLWDAYKQLALPHGLRACWSMPIVASDGHVLGTFATYAGDIGEPDMEALDMVASCAHLGAVALERERAQEALRQSRQLLEQAQHVAHLGHWEHDVASGRLVWSAEVFHLLGVYVDDFEPTFDAFLSLVHPDDRDVVLNKQTEASLQPLDFEFRIIRPDGEVRTIYERSEMTFDADGQPMRDIGVIMDVTESRRAQRALVESEQRYRSLFEHHPDAAYALDAEGRYLSVNPAFVTLTGLDAGEALQSTFRRLVTPEWLEHAERMHRRAMTGESLHSELQWQGTGGTRLTVDVTTMPIMIGNQISGVYGIARDITLRKAIEQRLRDSESRLRVAGRMARLGGWVFDLASGRYSWSDQATAILDLELGATLPSDDVMQMCVPEHRARMSARIEACATEAIAFDEEFEIISRRGRRVWLRAMGDAVRESGGRILRLEGAVQDITERKNAQARVQAVAARLTETLESITDAFITIDRDWRFTYVNAEAERLLRLAREELLGECIWERYPVLAEGPIGAHLREAMGGSATIAFKEPYAPLDACFDVRVYPSSKGLAVYFRDITDQQRAEAQLKLLDTCVARMNDIVMITDADPRSDDGPRILFVNEAFERRTGYRRDEVIGRNPRFLQGPETQPSELERIRVALKRHRAVRTELINYRKSGEPFWLEMDIFPIADADGGYTHWAAVARDIDERKQNERTLAQQAALLDNAQDAIIVRDMEHRVRFWNRSAERLYGWSREQVIGRSVVDLLYARDTSFQHALDVTLESGNWNGEIVQRRNDGTSVTCESRWTLVRDSDGRPQSVLAVHTDITERKRAERAIHDLAFYDPLTRLPNRSLLLDRLEQALAAHARNRIGGALLFIDMDNFKALNDTLGHDCGDQLLQQVAERLRAAVGENDTVARLGGDEFVVMLEALATSEAESAREAQAVGEVLLKELNRPYHLADTEHHSSASIGVTLFRDHQDTSGELLKRADMAMYQAKAAGRNTMCFFDPLMQAAVNARATLESQLRDALRQQAFCLHFQPQVDHFGRPFHAEALLRWQHAERGLVLPGEFIELAEDTGLIVELGGWVLERACRQLKQWERTPALAALGLSVNVSARQFRHPDFVSQVLDTLDRIGTQPARLTLELTESLLLTDVEDVARKMKELRARGVGFALDDFGTGYSSLAYLKRLPFDQLKIDQSFVTDILDDANDAAIARTIVALGKSLGLDVIAEGVETEAQRKRLSQYGCHAYQGFLFSHPLAVDAFEHYMLGSAISLAE